MAQKQLMMHSAVRKYMNERLASQIRGENVQLARICGNFPKNAGYYEAIRIINICLSYQVTLGFTNSEEKGTNSDTYGIQLDRVRAGRKYLALEFRETRKYFPFVDMYLYSILTFYYYVLHLIPLESQSQETVAQTLKGYVRLLAQTYISTFYRVSMPSTTELDYLTIETDIWTRILF